MKNIIYRWKHTIFAIYLWIPLNVNAEQSRFSKREAQFQRKFSSKWNELSRYENKPDFKEWDPNRKRWNFDNMNMVAFVWKRALEIPIDKIQETTGYGVQWEMWRLFKLRGVSEKKPDRVPKKEIVAGKVGNFADVFKPKR